MSVEIKFRAWDNKEKKWLLGYEHPNLGGFSMFGEVMLFEEWSRILNRFILQQIDRVPDDLILMQFTGFQDKNKVDIYEGDIFGTPEQLRCIVHREKDGAYILRFIHPLMKDKKISILDDKIAKSLVIGNIYANPELIFK